MVKRQRASSSSLFLMELIIAIMLFCLASSVCILAFVNSHLMHKSSTLSNESVAIVQNTAESIRAGESVDEVIKNLSKMYPDTFSSIKQADLLSQELIIPLDAEFNETISETPYNLSLECSLEDGLFCSIITFYNNEEPVFDLYVEHIVD